MSPARRRFDSFPPSRPLAVEGGLRARSSRGAIGEHWWSRRFVEVLESFALGTRLTRGKNYARKGQVLDIDVATGVVTSRVQGSRRTPYQVSVRLEPFDELVWTKVEIVLAEQAIHSAQLLAGEFPAELEEVFAEAGAPLFPQRARDLVMVCSCPDREVPCKHLSATFYLLAERFDDDPFLILQWRGRERQALLQRLRELRSGRPVAASIDDPAEGAPAVTGSAAALLDLAPFEPPGFWSLGQLPPLPVQPSLPPDLLLRQLPEPDVTLGGRKLVDFLRPLYSALDSEENLGAES